MVIVRRILGIRAREVLGLKRPTHEACMTWLAKYYGLTNEQLLETSVYELHNRERIAWKADSGKPYWQLPPPCSCCYCKRKNSYYY
jgi:hypothetical protein